ncbi:MAG: VanZ family protein [Clostridia bacterium]|nr:VanZ family protein [Clostridia bacterium]
MLFAGSFALLLWYTLFSRLGTDAREVYMPFWSFKEIFKGNLSVLRENIYNVVLFIPIGLFFAGVLHFSWRPTLLFSFMVTFAIETCQWLLWLGSFEFDDLFNNTLGALIGALLVYLTPIGPFLKREVRKLDLLSILAMSLVFLLVPLGAQWKHTRSMQRFAAMSNAADGRENLLILDGIDGNVGVSNVYVSYLSDGSLQIQGNSDHPDWKVIGKGTYPAGTYVLTGFSETPETAFELDIERLDKDQRKFFHFASLDSEGNLVFTLEYKSRLRFLVGVHSDSNGTVYCRPALYREEKNLDY